MTTSFSSTSRYAIAAISAAILVAIGLTGIHFPHESDRQAAVRSSCGDEDDQWVLKSTKIDPGSDYHAYVGNGYLGQRIPPNGMGYYSSGAPTGWPLKSPQYDGSFISGLYADGPDSLQGRQAIAAVPTWTTLNFAAGNLSQPFSSDTPSNQISNYRQVLNMGCGIVRTSLTWTAEDGRATDLVYEVLADRKNAHLGAVRLTFTPRWSGIARVSDLIDGRGARRITSKNSPSSGEGTIGVTFKTEGTGTLGAISSTVKARDGKEEVSTLDHLSDLSSKQTFKFVVQSGKKYEVAKYVGVDTSLTSPNPQVDAESVSRQAASESWDSTFGEHVEAWKKLWEGNISVNGDKDLQSTVRSAEYGLLANTREDNPNSISPSGLTSDNYAGQVFWDADTWIYPALLATHPSLAKSIIDYRFETAPAARRNAQKLGYKGLFYSWTSGAKGDLWGECQSWDPPHCKTQNHLMGDISLAAWQYYAATKDREWLTGRGWPIIDGIAEFWESRVTLNPSDGSYSIKGVAGPDEYSNGVNDGVFTNAGAITSLRNAVRVARILGKPVPASWERIADKIRIPYDSKHEIFRQYDGYTGDSVIKQADAALLIYPLEWPMSNQERLATLEYYAARTDPDGPAMTDSVHTIAAARLKQCSTYKYLRRSVDPFVRGPFKIFSEARGDKAGARDPHAGEPAQDFLTAKGGLLQEFTYGLAGLRLGEESVSVDPFLPAQLSAGVKLQGLHWQGRIFNIGIGADTTVISLVRGGAPIRLETPQGIKVLQDGNSVEIATQHPGNENCD